MELNIRDWLMVIGVLLFLVVALDAYRRAQRDRKNRVKITRQATRARFADDEVELPSSELPNGASKRLINKISGAIEDTLANLTDDKDKNDPLFNDPFETMAADEKEPEVEAGFSALDDEPDVAAKPAANFVEPEEILVMHVLANDAEGFAGNVLVKILEQCDCRYGDMQIFHRYEEANGKGAIQFSVVNSVEPGIFHLDTLDEFTTPGVSFFTRLPGPQNPLEAYNAMVEVAQCIAQNLHGQLKDEFHSTMTEQTLQHGRERIRDYLQRKLKQHG